MRRQTNPYRIEKIGLLMKYRCFDADQSLLNKFTVRGKVTIEQIEKVAQRLNSIEADIAKWDAIDKARELKEHHQGADKDTQETIKIELMSIFL